MYDYVLKYGSRTVPHIISDSDSWEVAYLRYCTEARVTPEKITHVTRYAIDKPVVLLGEEKKNDEDLKNKL